MDELTTRLSNAKNQAEIERITQEMREYIQQQQGTSEANLYQTRLKLYNEYLYYLKNKP